MSDKCLYKVLQLSDIIGAFMLLFPIRYFEYTIAR